MRWLLAPAKTKSMATVHLISGLPCSGKTTYSKAFSEKSGAVWVSLDYWLITAYGRYSIDSVGHEEHVRRVLACRKLIWEVASEFLSREISVILDDGFFLREHRRHYISAAEEVGANVTIHFLDTPVEVLRPRLEARNANLPQFNFRIAPETLENFLKMFEPPSEAEGARVVVEKALRNHTR